MTAEGFWLSVSELAAERGIDKATVSRRLRKFADAGLVEVRRGPGGTKLVNVAAFDKASDEALDGLAVMAGGSTARDSNPVLAREQARRMAYMADLAQLDRDQRMGKLLPVEGVISAVEHAASVLIAQLEAFPAYAEEFVTIVEREGATGLRIALRQRIRAVRDKMANNLAEVATKAGEVYSDLGKPEDEDDD